MITLEKNSKVTHNGLHYKIRRVLSDLTTVICQNLLTEEVIHVPVSELKLFTDEGDENQSPSTSLIPIELLTDDQIKQGEERLIIIKPFLDTTCDPAKIARVAKKHKIGISTLYRWRKQYQTTLSIVSLVDREGRGGKGKPRLNKQLETLIKDAIQSIYLRGKKSVVKTMNEIEVQCKKENLPIPHVNTVKSRISSLSEYEITKHRRGKQKADELYSDKTGKIKGADYPLALVQIDHTKLDIVIVDDDYRKPLGRPWLTLLIDLYSRLPVGLYISLDPPGNFGTGYAIYVSIYPKDKLLAKLGIEGDWPCWGAMKVLHCDNAGEFHSKMLQNACLQYGITIKFRQVKKPHYGGHIERFLGTFNKDVHDLPGTTYSNSQERKFFDYDSQKYAAFTLEEIEEWLITYIIKVYAQKKHSSIGMPPIQKYKEGIFGNKNSPGIGLPVLHEDEAKLRIDFMPFYERTIQSYGVEIENIRYYGDILKPYINQKTQHEFKAKRAKQKFQFKIDSRDISKAYFLDPQSKEYFQIPYLNLSGPSMSIWEKREIERELKKNGKPVDETEIFRGYIRLREIEAKSIESTKKARRNAHRKKQVKRNPSPEAKNNSSQPQSTNFSDPSEIFKPFEDIEHESFT